MLKETSHPTMETQTTTQRPNNGQLIFVPHKDTIRLLEVYVKRSLSLNDGTEGHKKAGMKDKWVMPQRQRRHSSDPSLHYEGSNDEEIGTFSAIEAPDDRPEIHPEESEKPVKKKKKKPSLWKSFLDIFSRKSSEEKDDEQDSPSEVPEASPAEEDTVITCLPTTPVASQKRKSMRRKSMKERFSRRRMSMTRPHRFNKDLNPADITRVNDAAVSVEPTYYYYEKVSEELEKIIHEVKEKEEVAPLSDEEVINRIIDLTKEEGDAIDIKLKDNPTLSNFFQGMSYSSFQKLADEYLEQEASPTHSPPTIPLTAPELVKLAFTLDFTARIAGLSKQNIGHITGLGNRYLQDRFEYQQACSDHQSPTAMQKQNNG